MTDRRTLAGGLVAGLALVSLTACGSGFNEATTSPSVEATANNNEVTVLIGSSGEAETAAVQEAVKAWSDSSGIPAEVIVASDFAQEAAQGFASGTPADVLYVGTDQFAAWAGAGNLLAYGDQLDNADDFYAGLKDAFTLDNTLYCAPKDFSTLALVINQSMWDEAGLTDADIPTTWDELTDVATKLTNDDHVGLAFGPEVQRVGVFMAEAGGGLVTDGQATANSDANVEALTYVKGLMTDGVAAFSSDLGAGWGGEAFGKGMAAMVIEGNWITGAMSADYGDVDYQVVELPAGVEKGTLQYTNCWGVSAKGDNTAGAIDLVKALTTTDQQMAFAKAFGVMPSLESARSDWEAAYPEMTAFIAGSDYAQNLPAQVGAADVLSDFNSQLGSLKTGDPKTMLDSVQSNLEPVVNG